MSDADDNIEAKRLGAALASLRVRARMSQAAAGDAFGISGQGWAKYENGRAPSIFQPSIQYKLAQAVGATVADLEDEIRRQGGAQEYGATHSPARAELNDGQSLEIRDRVQAGAWLMADDTAQTSLGRYPVARDPRYPHARQWLSEVLGDSVNMLGIVERDLVHIVDVMESGLYPKTGDIVEVERTRFGGSERELTLKQLEVTPEGALLWPRSTNPRWNKPLDLREGVPHDEGVEVRIRGLVLAAIRRF